MLIITSIIVLHSSSLVVLKTDERGARRARRVWVDLPGGGDEDETRVDGGGY